MNIAEWILVVMLAVALFVFLVTGIVLIIKLIHLTEEAQKIVTTGQGIAEKADDIVDNVKGMTSVGGIVRTFANRVIDNQERKYAEEDAAREAARAAAVEEAEAAARQARAAERSAKSAKASASQAKKSAPKTAKK